MHDEHLDAIYFSGTDPHHSEYLCDHWQIRRFITGFTGSFGELIITPDHAGLWTDTRYFLQAENQLKSTGFTMQKLRVPGAVPSWEWLARNLKPGSKVGFHAESLPLATFHLFDTALWNAGSVVQIPVLSHSQFVLRFSSLVLSVALRLRGCGVDRH